MKKKNSGKIVNRSMWGLVVFRFKKHKLAMAGLIIIVLLMIASLSAPLFISYDEVSNQNIKERFLPPGTDGHIFGTDQFGRDLFARIIYGGQISLLAGIVSVGLGLAAGVILGGVAGYFGGKTDNIIMRICDVFMAVPSLLLTMAIVVALGEGTFKMLIALSVALFPRFARMVRAFFLSLRGVEYVEAAKSYGASSARIIFKHITPNIIGMVIIGATISLGQIILSIASLGFLGIGITPPTPEWGTILSENRTSIMNYAYLGLIPGIFIALAVMCLNFIGDGLRDALDPRTKT